MDEKRDLKDRIQFIVQIKRQKTKNSTVKKEVPVLSTQDIGNSCKPIQNKNWSYDHIEFYAKADWTLSSHQTQKEEKIHMI